MNRRAHAALLVLGGLGCGANEDPKVCTTSPATLVAPSVDWRIATSDQDPFTDRPNTVRCIPEAVTPEGAAIEVDTGSCDYVTLVQRTTVPLRACDVLRLTVAHSPLIATETATAHVAFRVDDETIFDERIPIPSETQIFELRYPLTTERSAGLPLYFHVHNHGDNDWFVTDVRVGP